MNQASIMAMFFALRPSGGKSGSLITNRASDETGEGKRTFKEILSGILKFTDPKATLGSGKKNSNIESDPVDKGQRAST
ncbi:MAG: hypothetical protein V3V37_09665, partial [Candidatus Adiutricales bacterium]